MNGALSSSPLAAATVTLRVALRELRGGVRGFYVFIACLALGVMAIAAVASLTESLTDGLAGQSRTILGADIAFSLIGREAQPAERAIARRVAATDSSPRLDRKSRSAAVASRPIRLTETSPPRMARL